MQSSIYAECLSCHESRLIRDQVADHPGDIFGLPAPAYRYAYSSMVRWLGTFPYRVDHTGRDGVYGDAARRKLQR
jgi:hypothetical protein